MKRIDYSLPPKEMMEQMESLDDWIFYLEPEMSSKELTQLYERHITSEFCNDAVLSEISSHENTPLRILEKLADSEVVSVLMALALNWNTNTKIIKKLLLTEDYKVVEHLYWNKGIERSVLVSLSRKHDLHTLDEVIANID